MLGFTGSARGGSERRSATVNLRGDAQGVDNILSLLYQRDGGGASGDEANREKLREGLHDVYGTRVCLARGQMALV